MHVQGDTRATPTTTHSATVSPESARAPKSRQASRVGIPYNAAYSAVGSPSVQDSDLLTPLPGKTPLLNLDDVSAGTCPLCIMCRAISFKGVHGHCEQE